jgi:hypothetical protein
MEYLAAISLFTMCLLMFVITKKFRRPKPQFKLKYSISAFIVALGLGYYLGTSYGAKTEVETVEKETVKRDIITVVKEVKRPDGTIEREETTHDRSKEKKRSETSVTVSAPPPANRVALTALTSNFREQEAYELRYERRLAGPLWVGISANTKNVYGVSVAYEF